MKKQLILVNGAMSVGKSAVCRELLRQLTFDVWLDGDWCWNMNLFVVSEENKRMVLSNITHLLRAYLKNSSYRYVLFCWISPELTKAGTGPDGTGCPGRKRRGRSGNRKGEGTLSPERLPSPVFFSGNSYL